MSEPRSAENARPCCPGHGTMAHVRGCVNHPEHTADNNDEPCLYTWPDANGVREHVCLQTGAHAHSCAVCGPRVIPPAKTEGER